MAYAYDTFDAWLRGHGFATSLDETGELRDGTAQSFLRLTIHSMADRPARVLRRRDAARYDLPSDQQFRSP